MRMFASDFDQNPGVSSVSGISGVSQMKRFSFSLKLVFSFRPVRPVRPVRLFLNQRDGSFGMPLAYTNQKNRPFGLWFMWFA